MYVCLCNGYRESELRAMARCGYSDAEDAYRALGDGPSCGCCVDFAQEIMDLERGRVAAESPASVAQADPGGLTGAGIKTVAA